MKGVKTFANNWREGSLKAKFNHILVYFIVLRTGGKEFFYSLDDSPQNICC